MIKCEKGMVTLKGDEAELTADFSTIICAFRAKYGEHLAEMAIRLSRASEEELEEMNERTKEALERAEKELRLLSMAGVLSMLPEEELERLRKELK